MATTCANCKKKIGVFRSKHNVRIKEKNKEGTVIEAKNQIVCNDCYKKIKQHLKNREEFKSALSIVGKKICTDSAYETFIKLFSSRKIKIDVIALVKALSGEKIKAMALADVGAESTENKKGATMFILFKTNKNNIIFTQTYYSPKKKLMAFLRFNTRTCFIIKKEDKEGNYILVDPDNRTTKLVQVCKKYDGFKLGDFGYSRRNAREPLTISPKKDCATTSFENMVKEVKELCAKGRYNRALGIVDSTMYDMSWPNNYYIFACAGLKSEILGNLGRNEEALSWDELAIALNPNLWELKVVRAYHLVAAERFKDAEKEINKLHEQEPKSMQVKELKEYLRQTKAEVEFKKNPKKADIGNMGGVEFERFVCYIFKQKGYEAHTTPGSSDYGCDILAKNDKETIAIQTKRWKDKVNLKAVQEALGAKEHFFADRAIVITNNKFLKSAKALARTSKVELWDGIRLKEEVNKL